jgi:hypothetical protein
VRRPWRATRALPQGGAADCRDGLGDRKGPEMSSLDSVMSAYEAALSMDVDREKLLGMMPGMLKFLALRPDRRKPIFDAMPGMMADAGATMDKALVMDMMPHAARVLGEHPELGRKIIGVMVEMMGVFGMRMTPDMIMKMMPVMMPLMLRHPTLIPPFMAAMPRMMAKPKEVAS